MDNGTSTTGISQVSADLEKSSQQNQNMEYQQTLVVIPPDGGWGWIVVVGAFTCFLLVDGILFSFGVFLNKMSEDLQCSKSEFSISAAIGTGVFCLSGPFAASMVNNYGYRSVGLAGCILGIIACLATSAAESVYLVYFTYGAIGGLGFGLIYMPGVIAVGFYFEKWRGIATGIATCGAGIGGVVMPVMCSIMLDRAGWRQTFRILAALLVIAAICIMLFRPIEPTQKCSIRTNTETTTVIQSSNFFNTYHNRTYPTLSEVTEVPTVTLLQPKKLNTSSEVMIMSYPSSIRSKMKEDEVTRNGIPTDLRTVTTTDDTTVYDSAMNKKRGTTLLVKGKKERKIPIHKTKTFFGTLGTNMRPMYRDDIFYDSSFNFLQRCRKAEQTSQKSAFSKSTMEYHMSVTRVTTSKDMEENRCAICTEAVKRTLATMLDYTLLKSPTFVLISLNASFFCLGYFSTYVFIKDRAEQDGVPEAISVWLISIVGIANTLGRIICGLLASCPKMNYTLLSAVCLIIGGSATIVSAHATNVAGYISFAVLYGCFVACIPALRTIIIVDTLGLNKLTNAIGLILMFQGLASLIGLAIAGLLRDATGNYYWSFYFSGICIIIGGLILVPVKTIAQWERQRKESK